MFIKILPQTWKKLCFLVIIAHQYFQFFFSFMRCPLPLPGYKPKFRRALSTDHEIKRRFLLGRKVMTNLDSIWKSRDVTLPNKVRLVKAMVFPMVMYGCESWTIKKAECRRIDAFELWCWRRLLRVPWTAKEIQPVHSQDQPWDFFGRNDAKVETPVLWPPHAKS